MPALGNLRTGAKRVDDLPPFGENRVPVGIPEPREDPMQEKLVGETIRSEHIEASFDLDLVHSIPLRARFSTRTIRRRGRGVISCPKGAA